MYTHYLPNLFNGFLLKSARNNCCASGERNCGIPNLALKNNHPHIFFIVHHAKYHVNGSYNTEMAGIFQDFFFYFHKKNTKFLSIIIKSIFLAIKYERREIHVLQNKSE